MCVVSDVFRDDEVCRMLMRMYCRRQSIALQHADGMVCGVLMLNGIRRGHKSYV